MPRVALMVLMAATAQVPSFDVASVKPNKSGENRIGFGFPTGGLTATSLPLRALIIQAYKLNEYEQLNLPDWEAEERYDIAAKTLNAQASGDERLAMLQTLLADRFKLRMHPEQREMATMFSLVYARDDKRLGPDITPSTVDCVARSRAPQNAAPPAAAAPGQPLPSPPTGASAQSTAPSLTTAIQEQLGLKLESGRAQVPVQVVDRRRPSNRRLVRTAGRLRRGAFRRVRSY